METKDQRPHMVAPEPKTVLYGDKKSAPVVLEPWQGRLVEEYNQLHERWIKLLKFTSMNNPKYFSLSAVEQWYLRHQCDAMQEYFSCLAWRVEHYCSGVKIDKRGVRLTEIDAIARNINWKMREKYKDALVEYVIRRLNWGELQMRYKNGEIDISKIIEIGRHRITETGLDHNDQFFVYATLRDYEGKILDASSKLEELAPLAQSEHSKIAWHLIGLGIPDVRAVLADPTRLMDYVNLGYVEGAKRCFTPEENLAH